LAALKDIYSAEDIDKAQAAAKAFELAIPQRGHLRRQERHRARPQVTGDPQIQLGLPSGQPLGSRSLQRRQLDVVVRRK
jgi:hypothetical protein